MLSHLHTAFTRPWLKHGVVSCLLPLLVSARADTSSTLAQTSTSASTPFTRTNNQAGASTAQVPASNQPSSRAGHQTETNVGQQPHGSSDAPIIAGAAAGAAAVVIGELIAHHNASPEGIGKSGPQVPKQFEMTNFAIKGLIGPKWPVVLDFAVDGPGAVQVTIVASDKHQFRATLTNAANRRGYAIFRLPDNFGTKVQTASFQIQTIPALSSTSPAPGLRTYGLGAGEKAVGSVAIDQLMFGPSPIHPALKEVAAYSFHAHSAFSGVRAEFIYTTLYNGHVLVQADQEAKLDPIPADEMGRGTWGGKGKGGQHMLQIRAWRGLEDGGDWVVAWSPDIVDVVK